MFVSAVLDEAVAHGDERDPLLAADGFPFARGGNAVAGAPAAAMDHDKRGNLRRIRRRPRLSGKPHVHSLARMRPVLRVFYVGRAHGLRRLVDRLLLPRAVGGREHVLVGGTPPEHAGDRAEAQVAPAVVRQQPASLGVFVPRVDVDDPRLLRIGQCVLLRRPQILLEERVRRVGEYAAVGIVHLWTGPRELRVLCAPQRRVPPRRHDRIVGQLGD